MKILPLMNSMRWEAQSKYKWLLTNGIIWHITENIESQIIKQAWGDDLVHVQFDHVNGGNIKRLFGSWVNIYSIGDSSAMKGHQILLEVKDRHQSEIAFSWFYLGPENRIVVSHQVPDPPTYRVDL